MQILHLTDLHYERNRPYQVALIKALIKNLKEEANGFAPDFLVFSGDLVKSPDDPDIYAAFQENFLMPVLDVVGLTQQEVILCPGNHDVSHSAVKQWAAERERLVTAMAGDHNAFTKLMQNGPFTAYARDISKKFFELAEHCGAPWTNPFAHTYSFASQKISFVALNTAFGCGTEGSAFDRGKLAVPAEIALAAFQEAPEEHAIYSLMHHTPSDLNEAAQRTLMPVIKNEADIHLYGHVHDALPIIEKNPHGTCFLIQGGALFEDQRIYNGYARVLGDPQTKHAAVYYRTYYPSRSVFDEGTNVTAGGVFFSSDAAKTFFQNVQSAPSDEDICLWLIDSAAAMIAELDKTITGRSLLDTFVEPLITRASGDDASALPQRVSIEQIVQGKSNVVIASDSEYGATSLLSYLVMRIYQKPLTLDAPIVPIFIDGRQIRRSYSAAIASTLRAGLPESTDPRFKLKPLHDIGRLLIVVDNTDPSDTSHFEFLGAVRSEYPKARLIVSVRMPFFETNRLRPVIGLKDYEFLQLSSLTRGKVRTLVEKWRLPESYNVDAVVDEIHSKFRALGIPQTAAYVVIYLAVLEDIKGYNPINSSTVIEQFVESALQKYKPAYIFRGAFDYRNQIDYLGAMAERMCKINRFSH